MNKIIDSTTHLTRAIIWLTDNFKNPEKETYRGIDYILDGLLTQSLNANNEFENQVMIGKNFSQSVYIVVTKKIVPNEMRSFFELIQKEIKAENTILIIDENNSMSDLKKIAPKDMSSKFQTIT